MPGSASCLPRRSSPRGECGECQAGSSTSTGSRRPAWDLLLNSTCAGILEPLEVGLRLAIGEDVKVAAEVMEIGRDVEERIQQKKEERESLPKS